MKVKELLEKCGQEDCRVAIYSFLTKQTSDLLYRDDAIKEYGDNIVFSWTVEDKREIFIRIDHN